MSGVTVAVLGAGGTIAPAIVRDLAESVEVESLRLIDLDGERAALNAQRHGLDKAEVVTLTRGDTIAPHLEGCATVVNSASYRINMAAMEAALEAGCNYIDLGGLYWETAKQLELSDAFEQAGKLALLGMGSSPGKTNVMGVAAVRALGTTPKYVNVIAAGRDLDPPQGGLSVPYSLRTMIDELTLKPVVVRDGKVNQVEPLTDGGAVEFGDPIGVGDTIFTLHSEVLTFPESFGCKESSFRLSLKPELIEALRELTGAPADEIDDAGRTALPPSPHTVSAHVVEAGDGMRTARVLARTVGVDEWGIGGGVVSTGTPASAAVRLIERGKIDAVGALPPERCVEPEDLFAELEQRGCSFTTDINEAVNA